MDPHLSVDILKLFENPDEIFDRPNRRTIPCVVDLKRLDSAEQMMRNRRAELRRQALNRIAGEDDLGMRAQLIREVLETRSQEEVLALLPETAESLASLVSLGQEDIASYLEAWERAQAARLKHLQFQLLPNQLEMVEEALARLLPEARKVRGESPNERGVALFLLCKRFLELEEASP